MATKRKTVELELSRYPDMDDLFRKVGAFGEDHTDVTHRALEALAARLAVPAGGGGENGNGTMRARPTTTVPVRRAARGSVTEAEAFVPHILAVLLKKPNCSAPSSVVVKEVIERMQDVLTPVDRETLPRNQNVVRAENKAMWGRQIAVQRGLLLPKSQSGHGVWTLSPKGVKHAHGVA
jgi:hypothetical protein